jgi:hypothetical protein
MSHEAPKQEARTAHTPTHSLHGTVGTLLKAFDEGVFVRDISRDHEPAWAIRLAFPLAALARLQQWHEKGNPTDALVAALRSARIGLLVKGWERADPVVVQVDAALALVEGEKD